jgi:hypothetical protein
MSQITTTGNSGFLYESGAFDQAYRAAQAFAASKLVPVHFQGRPEDCFVALTVAHQLGIPPLMALQNVYMVSGRPGFSASLVIALANKSGVFAAPITWATEGTGNDLAVTASATLAGSGERVSSTVTMATAIAEGWTRNPKYKSMPEHMLRLRSATWLVRLFCPETLLGFHTSDELADVSAAKGRPIVVEDVTPAASAPAVRAEIISTINQEITGGSSNADDFGGF